MTYFIVFLLMIAILFGFYLLKNRNRYELKETSNTPQKAIHSEPSLEHIQKGGILSLSRVGPELIDIDAKVQKRNLYQKGAHQWHELECDCGSFTCWITFDLEHEDKIHIGLEKSSLQKLSLSMQQIKSLTHDNPLSIKGKAWFLSETGTASYFPNGKQSEEEEFQFWELKNAEETEFLSIEVWEDNSVDVNFSNSIEASQISLYSN